MEICKLHTFYIELCEVANIWTKMAGGSTWGNKKG